MLSKTITSHYLSFTRQFSCCNEFLEEVQAGSLVQCLFKKPFLGVFGAWFWLKVWNISDALHSNSRALTWRAAVASCLTVTRKACPLPAAATTASQSGDGEKRNIFPPLRHRGDQPYAVDGGKEEKGAKLGSQLPWQQNFPDRIKSWRGPSQAIKRTNLCSCMFAEWREHEPFLLAAGLSVNSHQLVHWDRQPTYQ